MGGWKTAAVARAARLLPQPLRSLLGAVPRKRRGVLRSARVWAARRTSRDSRRHKPRPYRVLLRRARRTGAGDPRTLGIGRSAYGVGRRALLRGSRQAFQPGAP